MKRVEFDDYERAYATFEWDLPRSFNFGGDVVDHWASVAPDRPALIWCDDEGSERHFTYRDIKDLSDRCADALVSRGLRKGDRVVIMLPRLPAWQIAMVGCLKAGAVPIPCVEMLTAKDIAYRIAHAGARAAITTGGNVAKFANQELDIRLAVGGAEGWDDFQGAIDTAASGFEPVAVGIDEPAVMYYTSGSTGNPKGVLHGARSLFAWRVSAWTWNDLHENDVMWCTADTGWSKAGTSILFGPWSCGSTVLFYNGPFDGRSRFALLEKYRVTVFCAAATELRRLVGEDPSEFDLTALRLTISAGESVNPEIVSRWRELTGSPLLDGYGQTETLMTVLNYRAMPVRPGSMGKPMPGIEMVVLSDNDGTAAVGEVGELALRLPSPQFMLGYWREPERTEDAKVTIGGTEYFLTGDLAHRDEDGYLFYAGRADDVINSAGYRIGPMEVENALVEHPAVRECAAVASPHPERGEVVKAFVVLNEGVVGDDALIEELQNHAKRVTAPYKYPRKIEFVADLPKTPTGKIRRRELRDREFGRG